MQPNNSNYFASLPDWVEPITVSNNMQNAAESKKMAAGNDSTRNEVELLQAEKNLLVKQLRDKKEEYLKMTKSYNRMKNDLQKEISKVTKDSNRKKNSFELEISKLKGLVKISDDTVKETQIQYELSKKTIAELQSKSEIEILKSQSTIENLKGLLKQTEESLYDAKTQIQNLKDQNNALTKPVFIHQEDSQKTGEDQISKQCIERLPIEEKLSSLELESIDLDEFQDVLLGLLARIKKKGKIQDCKKFSDSGVLIQSINITIVSENLKSLIRASSTKLKDSQIFICHHFAQVSEATLVLIIFFVWFSLSNI
ncbi:hypothetical protein HI914_00693 [Erysiphe necator]|nr:hypothetical protein HI914_00693 [Erysiphe necator]